MKLYLSSFRLGKYPEKLLELVVSTVKNKKIAYITNALDASTNQIKLLHSINRDIKDLELMNLTVENLDLKDYFGKEKQLEKKLEEFGSVYVCDGNIFVLRRAFKESGFDNILLRYAKEKDDFIYAGYSAGLCVMTQNFNGLELVDDRTANPEDYPVLEKGEQYINTGLGLVNYSIAPNFRSDHAKSQKMNDVIEYFLTHQVLFKVLVDGDVVVLDARLVEIK